MKKTYMLIAAGTALAGAAAAAVLAVRKKTAANDDKPASEGTAKKKTPANLAAGEYSFVSGYNDAKTVKAFFDYDADRFSYSVVEEDFLTYSGNAHVGVLYGEDFNFQIEYLDYVTGDDFDKHIKYLSGKYSDLKPAVYGDRSGFCYRDGDGVCFVFPATEHSCILLTFLLAKGSKLTLSDIPVNSDVSAILETLRFE